MSDDPESTLPREHIVVEDDRTGMSRESLKRAFLDNLLYEQARFRKIATRNDHYLAAAHTVRDRLLHRWIHTAQALSAKENRVVCYLSAEYLMGPQLANNLMLLGITDRMRDVLAELDIDLEALFDHEEEPGLGNGGLGRLAACYLDSLASLQIPAIGYGIRYEFGIFDQRIQNGWQQEISDRWLQLGNPWEIARREASYRVGFGGHTESGTDSDGDYRVQWVPNRVVRGFAYDTPILGYRVNTCNTLRLWKAEAVKSFDFEAFNVGDYYTAVEEKMRSENLTKVLYPNDEPEAGKQLRLEQQYFFVSCSLQDMLRRHRLGGGKIEEFPEAFTAQLNDTHPAVAVAELMRLLVDEQHLPWDPAWDITRRTLAYTNHTLLPEALETWSVPLFQRVLPRHLEIIYEINRRFLQTVRARHPGDEERVQRMSLIDDSGGKAVRMANLACVGSHAVNGVARLHTELLKKRVLRDFHEFEPEKFSNKTNGVSPRRFLLLSNPDLAGLIRREIGEDWVADLNGLRALEPLAGDAGFRQDFRAVKRKNKSRLASRIRERTGVEVDPDTLFDIQVKRIHEYKRQHLNVLHIITLYLRIKENPDLDMVPRTFIFGGKAAPNYFMAKRIIKLIHCVAETVNHDPDVRGRLRVVFFPDFNVKSAQWIYPAADLSEQISVAGKEASGTGNMKFALNGALTIGTLDGANIEIREEVGAENFFLFGLTAEEVFEMKAKGYRPGEVARSNPQLEAILGDLRRGRFSPEEPQLFRPLVDRLLIDDPFLVLADYAAYIQTQTLVERAYRDADGWTQMAILNTARMGRFSSDRSVRQYCEEIWKARPLDIELSSR